MRVGALVGACLVMLFAAPARAQLPVPIPTPTPTATAAATATPTPAPTPSSPWDLEPDQGVAGTPAFARRVTPLFGAGASSAGAWQTLSYKTPGLSTHATVMRDGRVLIVEGSGSNRTRFAAGTFNIWTWSPTAGTFASVPKLPVDLFCSGHATLPDGKVLFVGGTSSYPTETHGYLGAKATYVFNPSTSSFTRKADMSIGRWYPSALERADGSVLTVSGSNDTDGSRAPNAAVFNPATSAWSVLPNQRRFPLYPSLSLLNDGRVFYAGTASGASDGHAPGAWNPVTNVFTPAPALQHPARRNQAAAILLPPAQDQRVAVLGGGSGSGDGAEAVADTDLYDLTDPAKPKHSIGLPMAAPKEHVLAVILPDETVFETGGSLAFAERPVAEAAIYDPATGGWTQMNPPTVPRSYHAEAILLPDARVATLGSNPKGYAVENRIEVFSPPYLFKGERPAISSAPSSLAYGGTGAVKVTLAEGAALEKLVLIRPASVTHSVDPNQRLVATTFSANTTGGFDMTIPSDADVMPPGWYMLFAVDDSGRPSVAKWIRVS